MHGSKSAQSSATVLGVSKEPVPLRTCDLTVASMPTATISSGTTNFKAVNLIVYPSRYRQAIAATIPTRQQARSHLTKTIAPLQSKKSNVRPSLGSVQTIPSNNKRPRKPTHACQPGTGCRREVATTFYPISGATWIRLGQGPYGERLLLVNVAGYDSQFFFTMIDSTPVFDNNF